jgi:hypothetical protein
MNFRERIERNRYTLSLLEGLSDKSYRIYKTVVCLDWTHPDLPPLDGRRYWTEDALINGPLYDEIGQRLLRG